MSERAARGRLVILTGLPGAGKTTLATWLANTHGFSVASRDVIRAAMFPRCRFTLAEKAAAYEAMKAAISTMLALGLDVVTDGITFSSGEQLREVYELAESAQAVLILHLDVLTSIAQDRVEDDRRNDPTVPADRDAALVADVAARFDPLPMEAILIDANASPEAVQDAAARALRSLVPRDSAQKSGS